MMSSVIEWGQRNLENGLIPDVLIRSGIRSLLKKKLQTEYSDDVEGRQQRLQTFLQELRNSPIAISTDKANEQHYELPPAFFEKVLGQHLKYSSCYWDNSTKNLDQAEARMLTMTCDHAMIADGQDILELGCGWGSLTLFMAKNYSNIRITAVSNSRFQKEFIEKRAQSMGLDNVNIITADMNDFTIDKQFDRVVSVEMFEHMRNYQLLLEKVASWLKDDGRLFVHIFTHRELAYFYEESGDEDWIGKYFFTGGVMPSDHLLFYFQSDVQVEDHWRINGSHYQKTAEAWLINQDQHRKDIFPILETVYGADAKKWWNYWRVFFMSCAELWGYADGQEWIVSHYRFKKR